MGQDEYLYSNRAYLYDLIYHKKDYQKESKQVINIIKEKFPRKETISLLDLGCGTGNHLSYFQKEYDCTGVDTYSEMLDIARRKLSSNVSLIQSSMEELSLDKKFEVITCLFSSLNYCQVPLTSLFSNWKDHLTEDGIIIVELTLSKDSFKPFTHSCQQYKDESKKIVRMFSTEVEDGSAQLRFSWLLAREGLPVEAFEEVHKISLYSEEQIIRCARETGLGSKLILVSFLN